ncbi:hypothetical protein HRI_000346600 [Hibiscus trionum]|uniref:DUF4219 domain-containing protein n=1 Tax=Hibiscus trionum TaxID=183268 RepID=A0A9W7GY57_HIBTR|nr:hypothetical protein HRI_000346600 [Hibiscus trionum]
MTSTSGSSMYESQSTTKPSFFNGDNYPFWKNRMRLFIKSNDYLVWDVIEDDPYISLKRDDEGKMVLKKKIEMSEDERKKIQINDKALHMLFCYFGPDIYSKVSSIESVKEVWDTLETTYEGTNDMKETKIEILNLSYENFKMEPVEKRYPRCSIASQPSSTSFRNLERQSQKTNLFESYSTHFSNLGMGREPPSSRPKTWRL